MSTIRVNAIQSTSTTDGGISIDTSGHVTLDGQALPSAGPLSNRNLIINGAMQVAQRGTSSTSNEYASVDRFKVSIDGGSITQSQESLSSGDPYNEGFRNFYRCTNSTTATAAGNYKIITQFVESQNMANSGWNYTSTSSYVTLSFWVRASVGQDYTFYCRNADGTAQNYSFTFTLAADTWTKVTHTIPGATGIQFDDDNGSGLQLTWAPWLGTNFTTSGHTDETWATLVVSSISKDMTTTWASTTNATFDLTGVQLEVGSVATPFEHRSYGDELARCQRYYWNLLLEKGQTNVYLGNGAQYDGTTSFMVLHPPVTMRTEPSADFSNATSHFAKLANNSATNFSTFAIDGSNSAACITVSYNASGSSGHANFVRAQNTDSKFAFSAEL